MDDERYGNRSNVGVVQPQMSTLPPPPLQLPLHPTQMITSNQVTSLVIGEDVINIVRLLEDQNALRRRVEANEERIQELRASNQYLLQEHDKLINQLKCTKTIVSPVTLTTVSQSSTPVI